MAEFRLMRGESTEPFMLMTSASEISPPTSIRPASSDMPSPVAYASHLAQGRASVSDIAAELGRDVRVVRVKDEGHPIDEIEGVAVEGSLVTVSDDVEWISGDTVQTLLIGGAVVALAGTFVVGYNLPSTVVGGHGYSAGSLGGVLFGVVLAGLGQISLLIAIIAYGVRLGRR